jgi:tRNA nucleotidyltransferase (CCA-adding enzyme)
MFDILEVGGAVRDELLGITSKDVDFTVVATNAAPEACVEEVFADLIRHLEAESFKVFVTNPEFLTIRAKVPMGHELATRTDVADFVLARQDGPTLDGRRPAFVRPGTLFDDLSRRDFTVNAMARTLKGELVDPFGGETDLRDGLLRFVGNPMERVREDGLRVLRAFRFMVTKGFSPTPETHEVLVSEEAAEMLSVVSTERIREELEGMFKVNTVETLALFATLPTHTVSAMFPEGLRLSATMKS